MAINDPWRHAHPHPGRANAPPRQGLDPGSTLRQHVLDVSASWRPYRGTSTMNHGERPHQVRNGTETSRRRAGDPQDSKRVSCWLAGTHAHA